MPVLRTTTKRILYIHVPKTGGSYVEELMRNYGPVSGVRVKDTFAGLPCSPQHFHAPLLEHVYSADRVDVDNPFDYVFMTVRHPIERMKSEYRFRASSTRWSRVRHRIPVPVRFDSWLMRTLRAYRDDPFVYDNHVRPQHEFSAFGAEVFRLEDGLDRVVNALNRVTGLEVSPPRRAINVSKSATSRVDYGLSPRVRALFREHSAQDYVAFGYSDAASRL